jgi:hypothetical protein
MLTFLQSVCSAFTTVPKQSENANALLAIASVAAVVWTGGIISIQINAQRARVKAVLGMEYLQFAFLAPLAALVAEPLWLRVIATVAGVVTFYVGATHLRKGSVSRQMYLAGFRRTRDGVDVGRFTRNLLYYGGGPLRAFSASAPSLGVPRKLLPPGRH